MNEELIVKEAELYLAGFSFRKIAGIVRQSHITVRNNLTTKLKNIDANLYNQVLIKIGENTPKTINDADVCKRVLNAYFLLANSNMTIEEISKELGYSSYIIYRDLTKRLKNIHEVAPLVVTKEMVDNVNNILSLHSMANLIDLPDLVKE